MKATLTAWHHQGNDWKRELDFYVDELAILSKRLEEVRAKSTGKEVNREAGHFQKEFVLLREQIDALGAGLKQREEKVEKIAKSKPEQIDEQMNLVNDKIFEGMRNVSHKIASTRFEFNEFLATTQ